MIVDVSTGNLIVLALHADGYLGSRRSMKAQGSGLTFEEMLRLRQHSRLCFRGIFPFSAEIKCVALHLFFSASFAMPVRSLAGTIMAAKTYFRETSTIVLITFLFLCLTSRVSQILAQLPGHGDVEANP